MASNRHKKYLIEMFNQVGIELNGKEPWDIQINNEEVFKRVMNDGALGVGESYMDGWWDCLALDQFFDRLFRINAIEVLKGNWKILFYYLKTKIFNRQKTSRAFAVGEEHYDAGNELYEKMLDKRMVYTSAYWKKARNLEEAQEEKLDLVCRKIGLEPGMTVLEYGCGFGSFAKFAAEKYGAHVTGLTVSKEQLKLGRKLCKGLPVELKLEDYRSISGTYDRVISIGILEHVGYKNYRTYMQRVHANLKDNGIGFFHTIGGNVSKTSSNAWSDKYIFPNGMVPSIAQLGKAMEGLFVMEDWHNFGEDYDLTLMAWYDRFNKAWPELKKDYNEKFYRMWKLYLLGAAGAFRSRVLQLWQVVITKSNRKQPNCRIS